MPGITLDPADAAEIAETLTLLTQWLSGSQNHALADSFATELLRRGRGPQCRLGFLCSLNHPGSRQNRACQIFRRVGLGRHAVRQSQPKRGLQPSKQLHPLQAA